MRKQRASLLKDRLGLFQSKFDSTYLSHSSLESGETESEGVGGESLKERACVSVSWLKSAVEYWPVIESIFLLQLQYLTLDVWVYTNISSVNITLKFVIPFKIWRYLFLIREVLTSSNRLPVLFSVRSMQYCTLYFCHNNS